MIKESFDSLLLQEAFGWRGFGSQSALGSEFFIAQQMSSLQIVGRGLRCPPFILILMKSSDYFSHYVNAFAEASFFGNGKFLRSQVREEYLDCRSNVLSLFRRKVGSRRAH